MKILGIESSCDETAATLLSCLPAGLSVVRAGREAKGGHLGVLQNVVWSQVQIHKKYGGVVPEVAARQHLSAIMPVIQEALGKTRKPDLIAVTRGPGLITSLAVGVQTAKTLSYVWGVPLIGVNHLEAHLWSFLLNKENKISLKKIKFPAMALIVSGGHTELILVKAVGKYKLIGQTLDDAAGECFDKVAKMLELGYPGGPMISHFAKSGDKNRIKFPRPMINSEDFDFSFSGLKTSVKYHLNDLAPTGSLSQQMLNDVCASFQTAIIDVLAEKTMKSAEKFQAKTVILGGGVSANEALIKKIQDAAAFRSLDFYYPEKWLTGDNAAMIALAGYFNKQKASKEIWRKLSVDANLKMA